MARLFADENFPLPTVESLRILGHTVATMRDVGKADHSLPDDKILVLAAQGMAVLTMNRRHFIRLHAASSDHAGIIVCTFDPDFVALAKRIHDLIEAESILARKLLRINRPP